jgi:hypothetical protein
LAYSVPDTFVFHWDSAIDDESDLTVKRKKVAKDVLSRLRISE